MNDSFGRHLKRLSDQVSRELICIFLLPVSACDVLRKYTFFIRHKRNVCFCVQLENVFVTKEKDSSFIIDKIYSCSWTDFIFMFIFLIIFRFNPDKKEGYVAAINFFSQYHFGLMCDPLNVWSFYRHKCMLSPFFLCGNLS